MFHKSFQSVTDTIQLSLCDTTFLCASLFTAADKPSVRNLQVDLCLKYIRPAIMVSNIYFIFYQIYRSLWTSLFNIKCYVTGTSNPVLLLWDWSVVSIMQKYPYNLYKQKKQSVKFFK